MAAALTGLGFYWLQDKKEGRIIFFNVKGYINKMRRFKDRHRGACRRCRRRGGEEEEEVALNEEEDEEEHARLLMDYREAMSSFLIGEYGFYCRFISTGI